MRRPFLFAGLLLVTTTHAHVYYLGIDDLALFCLDSEVILRELSPIECAIMTSKNNVYNYAFVVRDGRCFMCRTADAPGPYRTDELLLHSRYLRGMDQVMQIGCIDMMTSSNVNIFRVTGHLCGKFTGHRWISHTKASDAELWCFLWSVPEWTIE